MVLKEGKHRLKIKILFVKYWLVSYMQKFEHSEIQMCMCVYTCADVYTCVSTCTKSCTCLPDGILVLACDKVDGKPLLELMVAVAEKNTCKITLQRQLLL